MAKLQEVEKKTESQIQADAAQARQLHEQKIQFEEDLKQELLFSFKGKRPKADNEQGVLRRIVELDGDKYHLTCKVNVDKLGNSHIELVKYELVKE